MPQPIDPYTELGRLTAAERIQQIADRASLTAQARLAATAAEERLMQESQVHEAHQKNEAVDEELRRKNPFMGKKKKKDTEKKRASHTFYTEDEEPDIVSDPDDHDLDVTI